MTSSIPFALPPVLSQRQFMQYYAIARAMGHSGGLEGTQAAYQGQYAWNAIDQITKGQPADQPPIVQDARVDSLQTTLSTMIHSVADLSALVERLADRVERNQSFMADLGATISGLQDRVRTLEKPSVSESPSPQVSQS